MNVLLIDANAVGYSANQTRKLTTGDGKPTQAIFHSIKAIWGLCKRYPGYKPYILWDAHCQWRFDLYPDYKGTRKRYKNQVEQREMYHEQRPDIERAFNLMGLIQIKHEGYEADDVAGVYASKIADIDDAKAVLYTGDKDWLQLVSDNVLWHDVHTDQRVSMKNFTRYTGYDSVAQFLTAKALQGDTSDNITGVGGIGEKAADAIMQHFGSVKSLLQAHRENGDFEKGQLPESMSRARNKINSFCNNEKGQLDILQRNLKLMNLHAIQSPSGGFFRTRATADLEAFTDFLMEFNMVSLVSKAETILNDIKG